MIGFDSEKYVKMQTEQILERAKLFDNKLYIEFGGKLFDDYHASRVLPGFEPDNKLKVLKALSKDVEILYCVNANDIENNRVRSDNGLTYDLEVLRGIDELRSHGLYVGNIVITLFKGQPLAEKFAKALIAKGEKVYLHGYTQGYPSDIKTIVSEEGYGANPYIETTRPIILVTAPGANSGKLATCLSQLYHEHKRGHKVGYAKFETFPIWNLPLKHPVNIAYEAATADIKDTNMIDPYYLNATGKIAVNYNRDIEVYPIVREILEQITGNANFYNSPTAMGVNMAGYAIINDEICKEASKQEIIRRYFKYMLQAKKHNINLDSATKVQVLMNEMRLCETDRKCILPAREKMKETGVPCVAIELKDGTIITGKKQSILSAPAGAFLNAVKYLCKIDDKINLISTNIVEAILNLKKQIIANKNVYLSVKDVLLALAIESNTNDVAKMCLNYLSTFKGCQMHSTSILHSSDETYLRHMGIMVTCDPNYDDNTLLHN